MSTYAHIFQRGRQFAVRVIEQNGQLIDSFDAGSIRAIADWLHDYHPRARVALASPACAVREENAA